MKQRLVLVVILLTLLSACASTTFNPAKKTPHEVSKSYLFKGQQALVAGDLQLALQNLRKAVAADPQHSRAHAALALAYTQLEEHQQAANYYRRALQYVDVTSADYGQISNDYGEFLCGITDYADAEPYFLQAVRSDAYAEPQLAYENAGRCAERAGWFGRAKSYYQEALVLDGNMPTALLGMARLSLSKDDFMGARAFLKRATDLQKVSAESLYISVQLAHKVGENSLAKQLTQDLLHRFPASEQATAIMDKQG
jgi:type IV pilus assembly protein PilF